MFCRKKKVKFVDLATGKDVSKNIETAFSRLSIPKDDDHLGSFTKYSDIGE